MRRVTLGVVGLVSVLAAGCGARVGSSAAAVSQAGPAHQHQGVAGWRIYVPPGWHTVRFSESKGDARSAGIQLSNVRLPAPEFLPGYAIQVSSEVLPSQGVGLIIATDTDRRLAQNQATALPLPLPWPDGSRGWTLESALPREPVLETLRFRVGGTVYIATVKIGWQATGAAHELGRIVQSIRPGHP